MNYDTKTMHEVKAGDVIVGHSDNGKWKFAWKVLEVYTNNKYTWKLETPAGQLLLDSKKTPTTDYYASDTGLFWISKDISVCSGGPCPLPNDKWNGKCIRCGKGTYQGLFKLEHDGNCL